MDKQILEEYIKAKFTINEISEKLGTPQTTIRYWILKYGLTPSFSKTHKRKWTEEQMMNAIAASKTVSDVLRSLGLTTRPGNYTTVRNFAINNNIDLSHMDGKSFLVGHKCSGKALDEILINGSTYSRTLLKKRLLKDGLLLNRCEVCGIVDVWNEKPIVMILDHINGINNDNRIENLRMLCPNCNSQQVTFCGKNKRRVVPKSERGECVDCGAKIWEGSERCYCCRGIKGRKTKRPSKEELSDMICKMSWVSIGERFGVSDNAVKKWAKRYGIV